MPSKEPPPKDNDPKSKSQPPKLEANKNDTQPERITPVVIGVLIVVVGIVLYAYFGA